MAAIIETSHISLCGQDMGCPCSGLKMKQSCQLCAQNTNALLGLCCSRRQRCGVSARHLGSISTSVWQLCPRRALPPTSDEIQACCEQTVPPREVVTVLKLWQENWPTRSSSDLPSLESNCEASLYQRICLIGWFYLIYWICPDSYKNNDSHSADMPGSSPTVFHLIESFYYPLGLVLLSWFHRWENWPKSHPITRAQIQDSNSNLCNYKAHHAYN